MNSIKKLGVAAVAGAVLGEVLRRKGWFAGEVHVGKGADAKYQSRVGGVKVSSN